MKTGISISWYILRSVTPYFLLSWLILTVILFLQQASRYSEIFFTPNLPSSFAWQIAGALIPNVIAFTCPMAVLVGVIVGLSRMQADSELVAIRTFGTGNFSILLPMIVFGMLLSLFSLAVNIFGVPLAAQAVRAAALRSALYKLESPIEPGVFNTEIAGMTIYVKGGDLENGSWKDVVIFSDQGPDKATRLITSSRGRIDSQGQDSELVLQDASVTTFPVVGADGGLVSERLGEMRFGIRTGRDEMVERLSLVQPSLEEMGLAELTTVARNGNERESRESMVLIVRRLVLAFAPLIFCILGTAMVLRHDRRGRGFGISLAIVVLLSYFLLSFAGEQLARSGTISPVIGGLFPIIAAALASSYFLLATRYPRAFNLRERILTPAENKIATGNRHRGIDILLDISTGIRDFDLIASLLKYYFLSLTFISIIFIVFTAFELWRFASSFARGPVFLLEYIFYLIPFIYIQVAPTSILISVLAVLTIKSRQNEIVSWMSAGQSVYRLIFPILLLMLFLGGVNFILQENVVIYTNTRQEALRKVIRSRGEMGAQTAKQWIADGNTIYSFKIDKSASDNGSASGQVCVTPCPLSDITIYNFAVDRAEVQSVYRISSGYLENSRLAITSDADMISLISGEPERKKITEKSIDVGFNFASVSGRLPSQLSVSQLKELIRAADSSVEARTLTIALERKYALIAQPLVIALIAIPFGIAVERRNRVKQISQAVGLWLIFVVFSSIFEQLGLNGMLPAQMAVWSPIILFAVIGSYLISKVRT